MVYAGGNQDLLDENQRLQEEIERLNKEKADLEKVRSDLEVEMSQRFIEAVRVPLTPQIVKQIREDNKEYLFGEMQYYTSVDITLIRDDTRGSSVGLRNEQTPRSNATGSTVPPDVTILSFREGGSSLNQRRILRRNEGTLSSITSTYDIFEVLYAGSQITLGFKFNTDRNWYDLEYAIDGTEGGRIPLTVTGAQPHLMTNYHAEYSNTETRIQMQPVVPQPSIPSSSGPQSALPPSLAPVIEFPFDSNTTTSSVTVAPQVPSAPQVSPAPQAQQGAVYELVPAQDNPPPSYWPDEMDFNDEPDYLAEEDWYTGEYEYFPEDYFVVDLVTEDSPPVSTYSSAAGIPAAGFSANGNFVVQVGSFGTKKNADAAYAALEREGFNPRYENYQGLTRVVIPAVEQKDLARTRERIKALGFGEPYVRQ
jgi:hypothetical protein